MQQTFKEGLLAAAPVFTYRLGYTAGGRNLCFGRKCMAGQQSGDPTPQALRV